MHGRKWNACSTRFPESNETWVFHFLHSRLLHFTRWLRLMIHFKYFCCTHNDNSPLRLSVTKKFNCEVFDSINKLYYEIYNEQVGMIHAPFWYLDQRSSRISSNSKEINWAKSIHIVTRIMIRRGNEASKWRFVCCQKICESNDGKGVYQREVRLSSLQTSIR